MKSSWMNAFVGFVMLVGGSNVLLAEGNASNRAGKTGYAAVEAIGLTMMPVSGLRGGYFISPDLTAELSYATGGAKVGDFEAKKNLIEAKGKYFLGDTFYMDGGLGYESWTVQYPVYNSGTLLEKTNLNGKVSNMGATIHLGNQWQYEGFTIGCDWVGYFLSLSTSSSFDSNGSVDAADKTKNEDDVKRLLGGSGLHLTRFYLGWSF